MGPTFAVLASLLGSSYIQNNLLVPQFCLIVKLVSKQWIGYDKNYNTHQKLTDTQQKRP